MEIVECLTEKNLSCEPWHILYISRIVGDYFSSCCMKSLMLLQIKREEVISGNILTCRLNQTSNLTVSVAHSPVVSPLCTYLYEDELTIYIQTY